MSLSKIMIQSSSEDHSDSSWSMDACSSSLVLRGCRVCVELEVLVERPEMSERRDTPDVSEFWEAVDTVETPDFLEMVERELKPVLRDRPETLE